MIKTKKLIALGVVALTGLGTIVSTQTVYAASNMTGTGKTKVTYTVGQTPGTDGDGNVSNWTVDYPVTIPLSDSTKDYSSGQSIKFSLFDTKSDGTTASTPYNGSSTVTVQLKRHTDATSDGFLKMQDKSNSPQEKVTMGLSKDSSNKITISSTNEAAVATLKNSNTGSDTTKAEIKAYLKDVSGITTGQSYKAELTWIFTGNEGEGQP